LFVVSSYYLAVTAMVFTVDGSAANVAFLKERHAKLSAHPLFKDMEYTEDPELLKQWMPLVMKGRDPKLRLQLRSCFLPFFF
jgi:L-2-hydroxyglutarate oxidase LhgO